MLIVFFLVFTLASVLIPSPMFPGSLLDSVIGSAFNDYARYFSAICNGAFYGVILWVAFVTLSKRLFEN